MRKWNTCHFIQSTKVPSHPNGRCNLIAQNANMVSLPKFVHLFWLCANCFRDAFLSFLGFFVFILELVSFLLFDSFYFSWYFSFAWHLCEYLSRLPHAWAKVPCCCCCFFLFILVYWKCCVRGVFYRCAFHIASKHISFVMEFRFCNWALK